MRARTVGLVAGEAEGTYNVKFREPTPRLSDQEMKERLRRVTFKTNTQRLDRTKLSKIEKNRAGLASLVDNCEEMKVRGNSNLDCKDHDFHLFAEHLL